MNAGSISAGVNGQLGLALLLMMSLGTEAAQAATAEPTIEEIVVTARRTQENLQDVPMVITAFDSDDLERKSIRNSRDLMFHTPSLTARTSQGGLHGGYSIRGLSGGVTTYNYHAEAPLGPRTVTGTLLDIASVQVLNGPQGTQFGRANTAGAVLVTPATPDLEDFDAEPSATGGNHDQRGFTPSGNIINGNELVFEKGPKTELITEELQIFGEALDGRLGWSM